MASKFRQTQKMRLILKKLTNIITSDLVNCCMYCICNIFLFVKLQHSCYLLRSSGCRPARVMFIAAASASMYGYNTFCALCLAGKNIDKKKRNKGGKVYGSCMANVGGYLTYIGRLVTTLIDVCIKWGIGC